MNYVPVPVAVASEISRKFDKDIVIIFCINHEHVLSHTTTFGRAARDKLVAADLGEVLAAAAGCEVAKKTSYEDFRLDAARLKEENDWLKQRVAELERAAT